MWLVGNDLPADDAAPESPVAQLVKNAPEASPSGMRFLTKKTRLWLDRSQVLCFYTSQPLDENRFFSFTADDTYLQVLIPPALLPGSNIGYIRLRPLKEGHTQIQVEGASIDLDIVRDNAASTLEQTRPEIVSPVEGAAVWDKFAVGVERLNLNSNRHASPPVLKLPNGQEIEAREVPDQKPGPHLRYVFTVDAKTLPPGPNELVAVVRDESGRETESEPVDVVAVRPEASALLTGDCKDQVNTHLPPPDNLPADAAKVFTVFTPPTVSQDDKSFYQSIVVNMNENPAWCMPVDVPTRGLYQMIVTARGDIGGNALPTVGFSVDRDLNPRTTARLATTEWQRVPVGHPVMLEKGKHIVFVRFRNAFNQGAGDVRGLYLARYELTRLNSPAAPAAVAKSGDMMQDSAMAPAMQGGSTMMQGAALFPAGTFHVAFTDALDGETIAGPVQINAITGPNLGHAASPTVDLLVNGKIAATSNKVPPQFHLPVTVFQAGANRIELRAVQANGQRAHSAPETLILPKELARAKAPLTAKIAYPAVGAKVGLADAVVANVSAQTGTLNADLLIDGQLQHLNLAPKNGVGSVLFPLLTRGLLPGPHRVQVTVQDGAGGSATSGEVKIVVAKNGQPTDGKYARAVFLLNRFGYGPEPGELAAVLTMGPHAWLSARLNETADSPLEKNAIARVLCTYPTRHDVSPRALQSLLVDPNPVRSRFVMWAENHFSTWITKDTVEEKSAENDRFLELGVAPFPDLLLASATSPAMLVYLDQRDSIAKKLNENYAREIMELHTLGVTGGYNQQDVTMLADLLTGWSVADEAARDGEGNPLGRSFRYDPNLNSGNPCQILGMEFPGVPPERRFDRVVTALNMLSGHPSCAYFISRKLAEHYVSDPAPPALVDDLARTYMETGGDLRDWLLSLSDHPAFWAAPPRVASPIDFGVRLARLSGLTDPAPLAELASHSGMGMFDRVTPDGYPDADGYFTSSNALLQRWHFAQTVQANFLDNGLVPDAWKPANNKWNASIIQRLIDLVAVRVTGNVLGANSNDAALKLIAGAPANTSGRLHLLATFLCQVPETSIR